MKLNKSLDFAVQFANLSDNLKIAPNSLAQLIVYADRRAKAWERQMNIPDYAGKMDKYDEEIEKIAKMYGIKVEYNGLYPTLTKNGRDYHLPG
jgi:hypothetical protein